MLIARRKQLLQIFVWFNRLFIWLHILTSVYYSVQKWDHLQTNRLFMGSKNIYNLL